MSFCRSFLRNLLVFLRRSYSVSETSFALFKRFIAVVLFIDLIYRWQCLEVFFTDEGVLPRQALRQILNNNYVFNPLLWNGSYAFAFLVVLIGMISAVGLFSNRWGLIALAGSFLAQITLTARNPYVVHGGDDLLRLMLLWAFLMELESHWTLNRKRSSFYGLGSIFFVLQLVIMYQFTAILKMDPAWLKEGTAIYNSLQLKSFVTPIGEWMGTWPHWILSILTRMTWGMEFSVLIAWTFLAGHRRDRDLICFLMIGFHFGLSLMLHLGSFPWICIAYWSALLSKETSTWIFQKLRWHLEKAKTWTIRHHALGRVALRMLMLALMLVVMSWNFGTLDRSFYRLQSPFWELGHVFRLHQKWDMFAPRPTNEDGWFVIEAVDRNGQTIDLWNNNMPVSDRWPEDIANTYPNTMWRKYLINMWIRDYAAYRPYMADYFCRKNNVVSIRLVFMFIPTAGPGIERVRQPDPVELLSYNCRF